MSDFKKESLLVIAPHPDDEIFGCGGLMHRVKKGGGKVYVLYLTVGTTKDFSKKGVSTTDERMLEIERVAKKMQIADYRVAFPGDEYHLQLDGLPQKRIIDEIERGPLSLQTLKPTILAFPSSNDYNQDHRAANEASMTAARPSASELKHVPRLLLEYELPYNGWSPLQGSAPNYFVALEKDVLAAKLDSLKLYASQMKVKKGPVSVYAAETLAKMRGILCGEEYAEAYVQRRHVV